MRLIKLVLLLLSLALTAACATTPQPHTYLKYSGYIEGCVDVATELIVESNEHITRENIDPVFLDTLCMQMYLIKLEIENIKPPMKVITRDVAI